jgi:glucan phosphoethanolaminetransferase (alkaline phosphatase superfamily)
MSPPYVVGDSSPFLKRVLIPFWVIRIIIMVIQIGVYGVLIAGLGVFKDDVQRLWNEYNTSLSYDAVLGIAVVILLIVLLCLILDLVCIIKRARRTLSPPFFLGVNIAQSVFYLVNFILSMVGASSGPLAIAISVIIL